MIANEKEFDGSLNKLGDLYEEGKGCVNWFINSLGADDHDKAMRLYDILKEMRDLSAVNMKKLHFKTDN